MLNKKIIVITGAVSSGKTTLLQQLFLEFSLSGSVLGYLALGMDRTYRSGKPAQSYMLHDLLSKKKYQWAQKKKGELGYQFNEEIVDSLEQGWLSKLSSEGNDYFFADDIGMLELDGKGFSNWIKAISENPCKVAVIVMKKDFVEQLLVHHKIAPTLLVDLDQMDFEQSKRMVQNAIYSSESERIAVYAAICSAIEVGIGSTLHALKVPFKGHFLSLIQNVLLIHFSKELRPRHLFWVVSITALLKSFSPAGAKLKPMFFIFLQGGLFLIPISILGVNIFSILFGSLLLGISTAGVSLLMDYIMFGPKVIESYIMFSQKVLTFLGIENVSVWGLVAYIVGIKLLLACVATSTYFINMSNFLYKMRSKLLSDKNERNNSIVLPAHQKWGEAFKKSIGDLISFRFLLPFILIALLIFFFTDTGKYQYVTILIRAIFLGWFGFLVARKINYQSIVAFLEKRNLAYVARSLEKALALVLKNRK